MKKIIFILIILIVSLSIFALFIVGYLEFFYHNKWEKQIFRTILLKELRPHRNEEILISEMDRKFIAHNKIKITTDENGFLVNSSSSHHQNPDSVIVFLGGSTTECQLTSESNRFPYLSGKLLEKSVGLKINSLNSGVSGNNSFHNLNILLNKIVFIKPDVLVLMNTANDLTMLSNNLDYKDHGICEINALNNIYSYLAKKSGVFAFLKDRYLEKTKNASNSKKTIENLLNEKNSDIIKLNFKKIIDSYSAICKIFGIKLVLMTEPSNFDNSDNHWYAAGIRVNDKAFKNYLKLYAEFNSIYRSSALKNNDFLIDLEAVLNKKEYFYDDLHYTDTGSIKASEHIADFLKKNFFKINSIGAD